MRKTLLKELLSHNFYYHGDAVAAACPLLPSIDNCRRLTVHVLFVVVAAVNVVRVLFCCCCSIAARVGQPRHLFWTNGQPTATFYFYVVEVPANDVSKKC